MARRIVGKKRKEQLRKINKNVLNKKSRIRLKYGVEVEGIETKSASDFRSVKEYNKYIKQMQSFTDRNYNYTVRNKYGVYFTHSEIKEEEKLTKRINRRKKKEFDRIKDKAFTDRGQPTNLTTEEQKGLMGDVRYSDFRPLKMDINRYESKAQRDRRVKRIKETYQGDFFKRFGENYKRNYIKALDNIFGMSSKHLQDALKKVDALDFLEVYHTENLADINFIYERQEADTKLSVIENLFKERGYL